MKKSSKFKYFFLLVAIIFIAFLFRVYGLNWDQNQHLHPDERFLTMVTEATTWSGSFRNYINPAISTLNPYNVGFDFYVYGTFPLKIGKFASKIISFSEFNYNNTTLVGRLVSAILDTGVVLLVFLITRKVFDKKVAILGSFLYAISVLPIQLSHFYAVDTYLVFFLMLSFYLLTLLTTQFASLGTNQNSKSQISNFKQYQSLNFLNSKQLLLISIFLGIPFGLALASKISAILFLPIIGLGLLIFLLKSKKILLFTVFCSLFIVSSYLSFRLTDPRAFATPNLFDLTPNPQFVDNLKQLKSFDSPEANFPPAVQWLKTKPIIFPLKNMVLWGFGLPLGLTTVASVLYSTWLLVSGTLHGIKNLFKQKNNRSIEQLKVFLNNLTLKHYCHFLILFWILLLFSYQGIRFTKNMRYFYPIYPFFAILTANFIYQIGNYFSKSIKGKLVFQFFYFSIFLLIIIWPMSFISIYSHPHSRILASEWIYRNIPPGSTISCEHWDDCLPLSVNGRSHQLYKVEALTLYDPDTPEKWKKINSQLEKVDYLIMSSNRLWGSIPRVPEKYPIASKYYENLFAERSLPNGEQFTKVAEITSYPTIPIINISIPDDTADESFTVYDHPKILIYKKVD